MRGSWFEREISFEPPNTRPGRGGVNEILRRLFQTDENRIEPVVELRSQRWVQRRYLLIYEAFSFCQLHSACGNISLNQEALGLVQKRGHWLRSISGRA